MDIKGRIVKVIDPIVGTGKKGDWAKQDFVIETSGQYSKKVCFSLWGQEKIDKYDLQIGLEVTVHFELESREYNGRWYTEARAWKIEWDSNQRRWSPNEENQNPAQSVNANSNTDDLPF